MPRIASRWSASFVTAATATLIAISAVLVLPRSVASATVSSRQVKVAVDATRPTLSNSAATQAPPAPARENVDLYGDSLGYQAEPYLDLFLADTGNYTVSNNTFGGTATCDWLGKMSAAAAEHPEAAILVFSGNAFTPCMDGVAVDSPQYYDRYVTDTERAIGIFTAVGTHVFLVGTPIDAFSVAGWDHLDDLYRQLARANPLTVSYVNAGATVESPSGGFTWQLPCMSIEPSCGANGSNVVRSPDGIHFCPTGTPARVGVTGPCDEYSPGAFRFALAIDTAVDKWSGLRSIEADHRVPKTFGSGGMQGNL